jgi:cell division transport system permease protein
LAERRLLPERGTWLTPWLIGVLTFVTVLVGAAGLAVANAAATVSSGAEQRWLVQLPDGERLGPAVAAAASRAPGVVAVRPVPAAEVRALLDQWLGPDLARDADLPIPALIDVDLAPGADPRALEGAVRAAAPAARLLSYRAQLGPLLRSLGALRWLALATVLLMIAATGAVVMLATRGAFDTHRSTVAVLHGIGATDRQLAGLFQGRMTRETLVGGVTGAIGGLLLILWLLSGLGPRWGMAAGGPLLTPGDIALLGLVPLLAGLLALVVARTTVLAALRRQP